MASIVFSRLENETPKPERMTLPKQKRENFVGEIEFETIFFSPDRVKSQKTRY